MPVPELWLDIFQKMVAAGLNGARSVNSFPPSTESIGAHCSLVASIFIVCVVMLGILAVPYCISPTVGVTNPSPGVLDFNDWRAFQPIFDAAKLAGIFVVLRAGELG